MHTLLFYDPGHFHAALTLRVRNPRLAQEVHVYAPPGPDLQAFLALVQAFNTRQIDPTNWQVRVHEGPDALERLIAEQRGQAVVLAGRSDRKLETLARLHSAGFAVLADKPWITDVTALPFLDKVTASAPLALDIITARHEVLAGLGRKLARIPEIFGAFVVDDSAGPAIELGFIHHLHKLVNGSPLLRPAWYFDVGVQGDGVVDIPSHLVDQVQWQLEDAQPFDYTRDVTLHTARRWATAVPRTVFTEITGQEAFPPSVREAITGDTIAGETLHLPCNTEIDFSLRGVTARLRSEWFLREPPGSGDWHNVTLRGSRALLRVVQGPETGHRAELRVQPHAGGGSLAALREWVASEQADLPGLTLSPVPESDGTLLRLHVPEALRTGHETHFAEVLDQFLDHLDSGTWSATKAAALRMRYTLLARARELALRGESGPLRAESV